MKRKIIIGLIVVLAVAAVAIVGASFYMLDYSLSPEENRTDTAYCFRVQFETYPETRPWVDSLRRHHALRDTFVVVPESGERLHAYYVRTGSRRTAVVVHGWRDCAIDFFCLARLYERELGYNVVMPDIHAHGLSEGEAIRMGWLDRKDIMRWVEMFRTDTMVVHGVSMGGATTMMLSGDQMPDGIRDLRFVDDCGYTSVWDEFSKELREKFGLPEFPLMYTTSLLCRLRYGWSFGEASALEQVRKSKYPMLFIHGDKDSFVPTYMVHRLYDAKPSEKELWIAEGAEHAESYLTHPAEYTQRIKDFCLNPNGL